MKRLPLVLSVARLTAGPLVALLILWGDNVFFSAAGPTTLWAYVVALALFALAAAADLLDAPLAKKLNVQGDAMIGALNRAAALSLAVCTLMALARTSLPFDLSLAALIIVAREVAVGGLREGLSLAGRPAPAIQGRLLQALAVWLGCAATLGAQTMIYFTAPAEIVVLTLQVARGALWAGAALALITGALFVREALARPKLVEAAERNQVHQEDDADKPDNR